MTTSERLKLYITHLGMSISKFEDSIGVSNGYVNNINQRIGQEKLNTILEKYSNLNRNWLEYGEGEMLSPETKGVKAEIHESTNEYKMPVSSQFAKEFEEMKRKIEYLEKELAEIKKLINTKN